MQLVEQGKLDLDADVNTYLKRVRIPATYSQPITLRTLMTHTAGFEQAGVGYEVSLDPAHLMPMVQALTQHMPARVRPPGLMSAYSNYGAALAGLIVEEVSGFSYVDYVQKNIFAPLDMRYATVAEPLPASLAPYKVPGYVREAGRFVAQPPTFEGGFAPAGSGSVSALDMAHFMIAHLQDGRYENRQILEPETAQLMHARAFQLDPRLPGMALGFYEQQLNGLRLLAHGGNDPYFNTELYLIPEKHLGIFVSCSGGAGDTAAAGVLQALLDRYFPAPAVSTPSVAGTAESLSKYVGSYWWTRRSENFIDKFYGLPAQISVNADAGHLLLGSGDDQIALAPVGVNFFQQINGPHKIAFRTAASGAVTYMFFDFLPFMPLERAPLLDRASFWYPLLAGAILIFLAALSVFVCRWRRIVAMEKAPRRALALVAVVAAWALATVIAGVVTLLLVDELTKLSRIPTSLNLFLLMPIVLVALTAVLSGTVIHCWLRRYGSVSVRLGCTVVTLAALVVCLFAHHWNLLGWRFG
jgi:CubicO group peptidase (beta-lactamase class C family)